MSPSIQTHAPRTASLNFAPSTASPSPSAPASALPAPPELNMPDALSALLALQSGVSSAQEARGQADAKVKNAERDVAAAVRKEKVMGAIDAAKEAKKHADDGGTFGFITDHIGVVGLIGLCTGQFYLVAEDMAAHAAQKNNNSTSALGVGAALVGGPLGAALELGIEKGLPEDWTKSMEELPSVKDDDVRVANKVALTVVMAEAMAAATVASGGATAPTYVALAGLAVSAASDIGDETGLTKEAFKSDAATASMVGHLTGAGLGAGAGLASAGSGWSYLAASGQALAFSAQASQQTGLTKEVFGDDADTVTLGLTIAGTAAGAAGAVGGAVSSAPSDKVSDKAKMNRMIEHGKNAKQAIDGADTAYRGYQAIERAHYEHVADVDNVEAKRQKQLIQRIEMAIDGMIADLKEAQKSRKRAAETIQGAIQTAQQATTIAIGMKG